MAGRKSRVACATSSRASRRVIACCAWCRRHAQQVILATGRVGAARGLLLWLAIAIPALHASRVQASDFWDDVRNPGSSSARAHTQAAERALAGNQAAIALHEAEVAIERF